MTHLDLNERERDVLVELLESSLADLRFEIADTDMRAFREQLKENRQVLSGILDALKESGEAESG
jgi:hypothetical protein